jgi:hypothetical protein
MPAQGNPLDFVTDKSKPCKGETNDTALFVPLFQGLPVFLAIPRALPWAGLFRAFGPSTGVTRRGRGPAA